MKKQKIFQMEPSFDEKEAKALYNYVKSGNWLTEYTYTEDLEKIIATFVKTKYASLLPNGTITLITALIALDLKLGDEILIPNLTMIASPNSASLLGIKPIFVDVEKESLCLDLKFASKKITKKTKALMHVSFNGRSGNMKEVKKFCRENKLILIEDAAQSLGSKWNNKFLGTFGTLGSYSFSVPKIISTGQGGALVTNNKYLYEKIEKIKDFGRVKSGIDIHTNIGWNFKFTDLQAIVGIEQFKKLNKRIRRKKEMYLRYCKNLKDIKEIEFIKTDITQTAPWFIDIYINQRDKLISFLDQKGIETRVIYPAINSQKIYEEKSAAKNYPVSYNYAKRGLWLPSSVFLNNEQIDYICNEIINFFKQFK